jgi:hypothetical protein
VTRGSLPRSDAAAFARAALFLEADELYGLTQRRRRDAQVRMLRSMGVEHRVRADGSVAVLRAHVEQLFGAQPALRSNKRETEPDWSSV